MIGKILPPGVAIGEAHDDSVDIELYPEELSVIVRAVDQRRREFTTVRACARQAFAAMGRPAAPILPGERGAPRWPDGLVGSMTHCAGYRAAAVAPAGRFTAIGIDAEPHKPLPDGLMTMVGRGEEIESLSRLSEQAPSVRWDRLLFSAKESVYKAWYPMTGRWLSFADASLSFTLDGSFAAAILVSDAPVRRFDGRWVVDEGLIGTAVVVPRSQLDHNTR